MAVLQSTDSLEEIIGNKYSLVIVSAKRARQLKEGHPALAQDNSPNFLSVAMREIQEGKIQPIAPAVVEEFPATREDISSLIADTDFDLDEEMDLEDSDAVDDLAALLVGADEDEEEEETSTDEDSLDEEEEETEDEVEDEDAETVAADEEEEEEEEE